MSEQIKNIPPAEQRRVVIAGAGFAGLKIARMLTGSSYQVVLIDRNNFHQFQPLLYQVATAGLEPSSIAFPLRKIFQKEKNVYFRMANLVAIDPLEKKIETDIGSLSYDVLVVATGTVTNYFDLTSIKERALAMKTVSDSIYIRNTILRNFEEALNVTDKQELDILMNIVIVGGGPTGVELAGALAEMKKYILPKDYPELDFSLMSIYLFEGQDKLLAGMSEESSRTALDYLERLGVNVKTGAFVKEFDGKTVTLSSGEKHHTRSIIWAAGVTTEKINGISPEMYGRSSRILVDRFNKVNGLEDVYVIGDAALMKTELFPEGHPQVAQPAIQQAENLARNLLRDRSGKPWKAFRYKDKGSLATVGRNLAVADLPYASFRGYLAWLLWSLVHLFSIVGTKNKLVIFINWIWNYFTYDQALRLLIKPKSSSNE